MGKRCCRRFPLPEEVLPRNEERALRQSVGRVAKANRKCSPAARCMIDGQMIDAVSEGMPLKPGQTVRVLEVARQHGGRSRGRGDATDAEVEAPGDMLSRPIESLGLEAFDDPLA